MRSFIQLPPPSLRTSALGHSVAGFLLLAGLALALVALFRLPPSTIWQALGLFVGLLVVVVLPFLHRHQPLTRFGPANGVTLLRAGIAALIGGLLGQPPEWPADVAWLVAALAGMALALDGLDGWLARRGGWQSAFGARFDMEVDACLILILAVLVHQAEKAGGWVILSGLLRYGFVALSYVLPWLARPLPPRKRRQAICVAQTALLALCLIPLLVPPWTTGLAAGALGLLVWSFTVDVLWLARQAHAAR